MLFLSRNEIEQLLDPHELITALEEGFKAISTSQLNAPPRNQAIAPKGVLVAMPANMPNRRMSVKLVTVFHENIPAHQAAFILFDSETSTPIAFMDGEYITVMRTAAGAILSIKTLARKDSKSLTIIGAGVLGHTHIKMIGTLVGIEEIWIASMNLIHTQALAAHGSHAHAVDSIQQAVSRADIVCLCTSSLEPVIHKGWLKEGVHVTSVGYRPPEREFPHDLVEASHVFVESRVGYNASPVGCSELHGLSPESGTELGEVVLKQKAGRRSEKETTLYKSMGHAMEDLVAANLVYHQAIRKKSEEKSSYNGVGHEQTQTAHNPKDGDTTHRMVSASHWLSFARGERKDHPHAGGTFS